MKAVGLTGGIGSGKSVISTLLKTMGYPVYDSDREAKRIMASSVLIREHLIRQFGSEIYEKRGLNKTLLSFLMFGNEKNLNFVNSIVHPEVKKDFICWKAQYTDRSPVFIESAILFESGFEREVDVIINVSAPLELRIERVLKRDKTTRESVLNRMRNQMSEEEKNEKADYVIINDNRRAILPQIENMLKEL